MFLIVLAILWKGAWGPIRQGLEKRESEVAAQIRQAQEQNDEARRLLADYEKKLAGAGDDVRALLDQGRRRRRAWPTK